MVFIAKLDCTYVCEQCEVEGQKVATMVRALRYRVIDISMGRFHTAVIVEAGTVWSFGRNVEGQLGIEGIKSVNAPQEVKSMNDKNVVVCFVLFYYST